MITDDLKKIAYEEGCKAFKDELLTIDNPYKDVSETLAEEWSNGWWYTFYAYC